MFILRPGQRLFSLGQSGNGLNQQADAHRGQDAPPQGRGIFPGQDMAPVLRFNRAGVGSVVHPQYTEPPATGSRMAMDQRTASLPR